MLRAAARAASPSWIPQWTGQSRKKEGAGSVTVIGGTAGDVGECVTQVSAVENGKAVSGSGKTYVTLTEALAEVREGEPRFLGEETFTVTVGTAGIVSDTTHPSTVARNATYHFKLTSASRPVFTGNNANFHGRVYRKQRERLVLQGHGGQCVRRFDHLLRERRCRDDGDDRVTKQRNFGKTAGNGEFLRFRRFLLKISRNIKISLC